METHYIEEIIGEHERAGESAVVVARPAWTVEIKAQKRVVLSAKGNTLEDALVRLERKAKEVIGVNDD